MQALRASHSDEGTDLSVFSFVTLICALISMAASRRSSLVGGLDLDLKVVNLEADNVVVVRSI